MAKHPPTAPVSTAPSTRAHSDTRRAAGSRRAMMSVAPPAAPRATERVPTAAELDKARAAGRVAWSPNAVTAFLQGSRTLGELEGISKQEQYEVAQLGYRLLSEGKLKEGKDVFAGLVALDPFDAYFLTALGSAHQQLDEKQDAERCYSRALEINPFSATARTHRGELRALAGRLAEAVDDLARVLKDDPLAKDPATPRAAVLLRAIQAQLV